MLLSYEWNLFRESRILNTKARRQFFVRSTLKKLFLSQPCEFICPQTLSPDTMKSESFGCVAMPYFKPYCRAQYCSLVSHVNKRLNSCYDINYFDRETNKELTEFVLTNTKIIDSSNNWNQIRYKEALHIKRRNSI